LIRLHHISKTFPGVKALSDVSFDIKPGEVHAICGENGAGKSTLMHILAGNHQPDAGGSIEVNGLTTVITDYDHAQRLGIAIVNQERSLIDTLSIAENIFINRLPVNRWGFIDYRQAYELTQPILKRLELTHLNPQRLVGELSPAEKMMIEIGKALSQNPKVIILDEPTASLTEKETRTLFEIIGKLKEKQVAVIYISHRLEEIFKIADVVTVLKDGKYQGTTPLNQTNAAQLIKMMVGREISALDKPGIYPGSVLLEVRHLSGLRFHDCNFSIRQGEILALAGLIGAGRSEIARVIFGIDPRKGGEIKFNGESVRFKHPAEAMAMGLAYVPEDRKSQALFLDMSVQANILSGIVAGKKWMPAVQQKKIINAYQHQLNIQSPSTDQQIRLLSGGNQQKCILARWLLLKPKLLIVDEPTQGIDIGTKFEIYQLLLNLAAQGTGIILISSELPEVLTLADRILVLHQGQIAGYLKSNEANEELILSLASGNTA